MDQCLDSTRKRRCVRKLLQPIKMSTVIPERKRFDAAIVELRKAVTTLDAERLKVAVRPKQPTTDVIAALRRDVDMLLAERKAHGANGAAPLTTPLQPPEAVLPLDAGTVIVMQARIDKLTRALEAQKKQCETVANELTRERTERNRIAQESAKQNDAMADFKKRLAQDARALLADVTGMPEKDVPERVERFVEEWV